MLKQILTQLSFTKEGQLIRAALNGQTEKVHSLLQSGVNPNCRSKNGYTPLMGAALSGSVPIAKLLLKAGSDPNSKEQTNGSTALLFAVDQNYPEMVKLLIKAGADLEATDKIGEYTPLFCSVFKQHVEVTKILIEAGANPLVIGNEGESILELAEKLGNQPIFSLLYKSTKSSDFEKPAALKDFEYLTRLISEKKVKMMIAEDVPINVPYELFPFQKLYSKKRFFLQLSETGQKVEYPTPWQTILDEYEYHELNKLMGKKTDSKDTIDNATGSFGYEGSNPIPVNDAVGERAYIQSLQCQCGAPFLYKRRGSVGKGPDGHMLDLYQLVCFKSKCKIDLYFDMYHGSESKLRPLGLRRNSQENGISVEEYLRIHPDQTKEIEHIFG